MSAPSLRELAAKLDLSHATVSAALRGGKNVKNSTRERVLIVARELGYRNNPLASALMSEMRRSRGDVFRGTLALLGPRRPEAEDPIAGRLKLHFAKRARELGFGVDELPFPVGPEETAKLGGILRARGVLGVLSLDGERSLQLPASADDFSVMELAHHLAPSRFHRLVIDWPRALELGLSRLHQDGARRVGLAVDDALSPAITAALRQAGRAFASQSAEAAPVATYLGPARDDDFMPWVTLQRCDAILATRESFLARIALPHPGALIAGLCGGDVASPSTSQARRLDLRLPELARHAADSLVHLVMRREFGPPAAPLLSSIAASWE